MDHLQEARLETPLDTSSQSDEGSTPTITVQTNDNDGNENEDSRDQKDSKPRTLPVTLNSVTISGTHGSVYESSSIPVQYHLKTENGQVTYRVVQVSDLQSNEQNQSHVVANSVEASHSGTTLLQGGQFVSANASPGSSNDGPFYVMMASAQEVVTAHSGLIRKRTSSSNDSDRSSRDEKRRATHNEVERRRRDKINNWISKLAKIVPDCAQDRTKQGASKGGILAKACEYITDLVRESSKLAEIVKENELLSNELDSVRQQLMEVKNENRKLRALLQKDGIAQDDNS